MDKIIEPHEAKTLDELQTSCTEIIFAITTEFSEQQELEIKEMQSMTEDLINVMKGFASAYARLLIEGKIPDDRKYKHISEA